VNVDSEGSPPGIHLSLRGAAGAVAIARYDGRRGTGDGAEQAPVLCRPGDCFAWPPWAVRPWLAMTNMISPVFARRRRRRGNRPL